MKTLKDCVIETKCRKGAAYGTTKHGAYWLACEPITIRNYGGDGIGQSGADCKNFLQLRHYRDGTVSAVLHGAYWHQNGSAPDDWMRCDDLLSLTTVESIIVSLKATSFDDGTHVWSDYWTDKLTAALTGIGLAESEPSPDE